MKYNSHYGFTLTELVIAIVISSLVLIFTFHFVSKTIVEISNARQSATIMTEFSDISQKIDNYRNIYSSWSILLDGANWVKSDVLLLKTEEADEGVLFALVDPETMKINQDSENYSDLHYGFRIMTLANINSVLADPNAALLLDFQSDKIMRNLSAKDLQIQTFNQWDILDINISLIKNYKENLLNSKYSDLWKNNFVNFNLNY